MPHRILDKGWLRTASDNIIPFNEKLIKTELKESVLTSAEETLNIFLDKEADELLNTEKYERSFERYHRRECSVEEALWGTKLSTGTISNLDQNVRHSFIQQLH